MKALNENEKIIRFFMPQRIKDGVYIKGEFVKFKRFFLFDSSFSVLLPEKISGMPDEQCKKKYPNEQRPQIILTTENADVNFCYSLLPQKIETHELFQAIVGYSVIIKKFRPDTVFLEADIQRLDKTMLAWFDYKSNVLDGDMYNIMYVTPINGSVLLGAFSCTYTDFSAWKPYALETAFSIQEQKKKASWIQCSI